jgi:hypothetical protein
MSRKGSAKDRRGFRPAYESLESRCMLATVTVNSRDDFATFDNNGSLTLREAIAIVNGQYVPEDLFGQPDDFGQIDDILTLGTNDKIVFAPSLFDEEGKAKIELENKWNLASNSALEVRRGVIIEAPDVKEVEIAAGAGEMHSLAA